VRRLIVDGQLFQTNAWFRGMGKYALQLLRQLSEQSGEDMKITLLFNDALRCDAARYETLRFLCPAVEQEHTTLPLANSTTDGAELYREKLTELIADQFPDTENSYLISSLFSFDFFAEYPDNCRKLLLFYDLTPLRFWRDLGGYFPPELYMERFTQILEADLIFSISQTTKDDIIQTFGLPEARIANINGGYIEISDTASRPKELVIPEHYILFPTGDLPHKNNDVTVRGFEQYCQENDNDVRLLITSYFSDDSKRRLSALSEHITFTENVSDEELEWLYEHADAILFGSKYEGLGLPILDAVAGNKPVITSRISVFEEMSADAFYYYDLDDPSQLAEAIRSAMDGDGYAEKSDGYPAIMERYTWQITAKDFMGALDSLWEGTLTSLPQDVSAKRPRLAIVSLHPGIPRQIGRLAEVLYAGLKGYYQLSYYFDGNGFNHKEIERPTFLDFMDCDVYDIGRFTLSAYREYDMVLYLIDDTAVPSRVLQRAVVMPGVQWSQYEAELKTYQSLCELAADNALRAVTPNATQDAVAAERLHQEIAAHDSDQSSKPGQKRAIIRQGGSNRNIIKKLQAIDL
jgi:glycosyltransferase involved in cell wall biosynthesis